MTTCNRCKKPTSFFPENKFGKPSTMCQKCYDNTVERNTRKKNASLAKSAALPDGMGFCMRCKNFKPTSDFAINPKQRRKIERGDELSKTCAACREYLARTSTVRRHSAHKDAAVKAKYLAERRDHMRAWRDKVIAAYGGRCVCCGETEPKFLELDHIDGKGGKHRREIGFNSEALYRWCEKNGFPPILQVLCANCHNAKSFWGICPHQEFMVLQLSAPA